MGELASMLMVTKGNITGVVRRLKEDGLVRKVTSKTDRRIQSVTISAKGRRLWDKMHSDYDSIISSILSGQSVEEVRSLKKALEKTRISVEKLSSED
jgi:DNA-binding MarR family transcriptional regulator